MRAEGQQNPQSWRRPMSGAIKIPDSDLSSEKVFLLCDSEKSQEN